ncbi:MAG: DUF1501 domain-containing protein [Flavobacteriales bacterium]|nr:DUF1501 domain-containing protein [Flavobacteriales bacterium]
MKRRDFLRSTGLVSASLMMPRFLQGMAPVKSQNGRKLVVVQLSGGNDGLNTVVPFRNDIYYALRPQLALARDKVLGLSDELGLNPGMAAIQAIHEAGELTILNGVGYPQPDRSHFRSMDIWHTASASDEYLQTGWLGRYMDATEAKAHDVIEFGGTLSLANKGAQMKALALNEPARFYASTREPFFAKLAQVQHREQHQQLGYLYRTMTETYQSAGYIQEHLRPRSTEVIFPKSDLAKQLRNVSAFIQSGMETSVYYTSFDGFDTHVNQLGRQQKNLTQLSEAIGAFWNDLKAAGKQEDVLIMVFSEFGRRVKQNASNGTDHGTASNLFLIGSSLKKPGFFNAMPSLSDLDENGDLKFAVDFRSIYSTLLEGWLGLAPAAVGLGSFRSLPLLS